MEKSSQRQTVVNLESNRHTNCRVVQPRLQQRAVGAYKSMKLIAANGFNPPMPLCARVG